MEAACYHGIRIPIIRHTPTPSSPPICRAPDRRHAEASLRYRPTSRASSPLTGERVMMRRGMMKRQLVWLSLPGFNSSAAVFENDDDQHL